MQGKLVLFKYVQAGAVVYKNLDLKTLRIDRILNNFL